jgi:hypothetical protein
MKALPAWPGAIRYLLFIAFSLSMSGCEKDKEEAFPLIGKWKMAAYLKTTILYTSGGEKYENSFIKNITPPNDIMEFKVNGEVVQGSSTLNYTKEVVNGDNRIIIESKSSGTRSVYSWSVDNESTLNLALQNYWEALGNPSEANKLVLAKSLASSFPEAFPKISTASSVQKIVITYVYDKQ